MPAMQGMHVSGLHSSRQAHLLRPCGVHRTHRGPRRAQLQPQALLSFFGVGKKRQQAYVQPPAVKELLSALKGAERGLSASKAQQAAVLACVEELKEQTQGEGGRGPGGELSATWRLLYTTEKETLFIIKNAGLFGTEAGEVYQVIDTEAEQLQNIITFPPDGAFIVNSGIAVESDVRTSFEFQSAVLKLPRRSIKLPPFGKGWFDTVYLDSELRVAQDSRGDTLIVARDGLPRTFE